MGVRMQADPKRVQQVVRNLLENARKYGGDQVLVEGFAHGEQYVLVVSDNGPGVPDGSANQIFEHFEQLSKGDSRSSSGIGLGLPIARRLARAMGGDVWYERRFPTGSRFCFSMPVKALVTDGELQVASTATAADAARAGSKSEVRGLRRCLGPHVRTHQLRLKLLHLLFRSGQAGTIVRVWFKDDLLVDSPLLAELNPSQREAVAATEGPVLVVAGAGSGKTRVLTHRIAHLIRDLNVSPESILAITFTNKAADEMRSRVSRLVGRATRAMWVSTFHSACVRILRREAHRLGYRSAFSIYDEDDSVRLITICVKDLDLDPKRFPPKAIKAAISKAKNELIDYESYASSGDGFYHEQVADVYRLYQQRLLEASAMDFDDLLMITVELFGAFPDVLAQYQERFRYILVDEYQDTNRAQYILVRRLSEKYRNLCVVGDGDQSIYRWRGADIRNINDFEKDFPDARVVVLDQNYRSTDTILDAANAVIANNPRRTPKRLWSDRGKGEPIVRFEAEDEHDEAGFVADEIERLIELGYNLADVAVFYRTNAQSRVIEDVLVRRGVPYTVVGSVKFYERKEIKDALAYLRSIVNPDDAVALKRIINEPRRGIGDTSIGHLDRFAEANQIPFGEALRRAREISQLTPGSSARFSSSPACST